MLKKYIGIFPLLAPILLWMLEMSYKVKLLSGSLFSTLCVLIVFLSITSLFLDIFWTIRECKENEISHKNRKYLKYAILLAMFFLLVTIVILKISKVKM